MSKFGVTSPQGSGSGSGGIASAIGNGSPAEGACEPIISILKSPPVRGKSNGCARKR